MRRLISHRLRQLLTTITMTNGEDTTVATLLDSAALARHEGFRDRVTVAMLKTAVAVAAEAPSGDARTDQLRADLATNTLNDPLGYTERFTWGVVTNATVADAGLKAPDGDIEYVVVSIWNHVAGV